MSVSFVVILLILWQVVVFLWKNIFILFYNAQNGITILSFLVLFFSQKQNKQNQRWCDMPIDHEQPQYKVLEVL